MKTGMPKNPVTCTARSSQWGCPKDSLCNACRNALRRKYIWTPASDAELKRIYDENARSRQALGSALRVFARRLGWPLTVLISRAMALRITTVQRSKWTAAEEATLRELAGTISIDAIAIKLKRGRQSVLNKLWKLSVSGRVSDGYTERDLADLFGVSVNTLKTWMQRRWLARCENTRLIPEKCVYRFLKAHAEEYDLRRVNQAWFKGMIFEGFGHHAHNMGDNAPSMSPYEVSA